MLAAAFLGGTLTFLQEGQFSVVNLIQQFLARRQAHVRYTTVGPWAYAGTLTFCRGHRNHSSLDA